MSLIRSLLSPASVRAQGGPWSGGSFDDFASWLVASGYPLLHQTWSSSEETIEGDFEGLVRGVYQSNGVVFACLMTRFLLFSQVRFQFQQLRSGRPGDLFGTTALRPLEVPWTNGQTGDLLSRMILDADFAGNSYTARVGSELVRLRPDWTDIVLAPRGVDGRTVGMERVGYAYYESGRRQDDPVVFLPDEVAHFAPSPDPLASYRGMSWLTPIVREIMADKAATQHKLKYFENNASTNMVVSMPRETTREQFEMFREVMTREHAGAEVAGGARGGGDRAADGQHAAGTEEDARLGVDRRGGTVEVEGTDRLGIAVEIEPAAGARDPRAGLPVGARHLVAQEEAAAVRPRAVERATAHVSLVGGRNALRQRRRHCRPVVPRHRR